MSRGGWAPPWDASVVGERRGGARSRTRPSMGRKSSCLGIGGLRPRPGPRRHRDRIRTRGRVRDGGRDRVRVRERGRNRDRDRDRDRIRGRVRVRGRVRRRPRPKLVPGGRLSIRVRARTASTPSASPQAAPTRPAATCESPRPGAGSATPTSRSRCGFSTGSWRCSGGSPTEARGSPGDPGGPRLCDPSTSRVNF